MLFLYNIFIQLYHFAVHLAANWNKKAREWVTGRKELFHTLRGQVREQDRLIWVHCASAGEFEQAKPVIEALKIEYPAHRVLVSFFSPSGFAAGKKYGQADVITYLPLDTRKNARHFMDIVHPELVIFIKYEFWYHHLAAAAFRHIPILLVSGIFRKNSIFFKWYGRFHRQMLFLFRRLFIQDENSARLLQEKNIEHFVVTGDTRFDRVSKIAGQFTELDIIPDFKNNQQLIVAGSTWPDDEKLLAAYKNTSAAKLIIAPHEITPAHLHAIKKLFPLAFRYSEVKNFFPADRQETAVWQKINEQQTLDMKKKLAEAQVLIIDNVGMLSRLYHYATIAYIGGGFNTSGIHNTLEAAVFGKPVIFGPHYHKFREARDLIAKGAAFSISDAEELQSRIDQLLHNEEALASASAAAATYVQEQTGATRKIMAYIQEKRLLTR